MAAEKAKTSSPKRTGVLSGFDRAVRPVRLIPISYDYCSFAGLWGTLKIMDFLMSGKKGAHASITALTEQGYRAVEQMFNEDRPLGIADLADGRE